MPLTADEPPRPRPRRCGRGSWARVRRDSRPCHWNGAHAVSSSARQPFMLRSCTGASLERQSGPASSSTTCLAGVLAQATGQDAAGAAAADDQPVRLDRPRHHPPTFIHTLLIWVSSSSDAAPSVRAVARQLDAAVGDRRVDHLVRVDPHGADPQRPAGAVREREVVGPHAGGQPVVACRWRSRRPRPRSRTSGPTSPARRSPPGRSACRCGRR